MIRRLPWRQRQSWQRSLLWYEGFVDNEDNLDNEVFCDTKALLTMKTILTMKSFVIRRLRWRRRCSCQWRLHWRRRLPWGWKLSMQGCVSIDILQWSNTCIWEYNNFIYLSFFFFKLSLHRSLYSFAHFFVGSPYHHGALQRLLFIRQEVSCCY